MTEFKEYGVVEVLRDWLVMHCYNGLCNGCAGCGCDMDDLVACMEPGTGCVAAYKFDCSICEDGPNYNNDCLMNDGATEYMMSSDIGFCHPMYVSQKNVEKEAGDA